MDMLEEEDYHMKPNIETLRFVAYSKQDRLKREMLNDLWKQTHRPIFAIPESHRIGYVADLDLLFEYSNEEKSFGGLKYDK